MEKIITSKTKNERKSKNYKIIVQKMSSMTINTNSITVAKGYHIDNYDFTSGSHNIVSIPLDPKLAEMDSICDIEISGNGAYLALITSASKQLLVYKLPTFEKFKSFVLPRSASKVRFTANSEHILVADKSGDALLYDINSEETGTKLLGHLSLLLDILQTTDEKYIVTCDRDEKIRVSHFPNTYNIKTFCLGHKEYVNHLELLPHDNQFLMSTSGDGQIKCWKYEDGAICHSIDTYLDIDSDELKENFTKLMDEEGIEVKTLPIVHFSIMQIDSTSSLLSVAVHMYNKLLIYKLDTVNKRFSHTLVEKLNLDRFPAAAKLYNSCIYVYDDVDNIVSIYKIEHENDISVKFQQKINVFENEGFKNDSVNSHEAIKILFKRKFDNVQEYQERKRQRLEKSSQ